MQVRKLSLQTFLARRRTTIERLIAAESITTPQQLRQWCEHHALELPESSTFDSLFAPKVNHQPTSVPPRSTQVSPAPVHVVPPPVESTPRVESQVPTEIPITSPTTTPAAVEETHEEHPFKRPRPRKTPRSDDDKIEDSE